MRPGMNKGLNSFKAKKPKAKLTYDEAISQAQLCKEAIFRQLSSELMYNFGNKYSQAGVMVLPLNRKLLDIIGGVLLTNSCSIVDNMVSVHTTVNEIAFNRKKSSSVVVYRINTRVWVDDNVIEDKTKFVSSTASCVFELIDTILDDLHYETYDRYLDVLEH